MLMILNRKCPYDEGKHVQYNQNKLSLRKYVIRLYPIRKHEINHKTIYATKMIIAKMNRSSLAVKAFSGAYCYQYIVIL